MAPSTPGRFRFRVEADATASGIEPVYTPLPASA